MLNLRSVHRLLAASIRYNIHVSRLNFQDATHDKRTTTISKKEQTFRDGQQRDHGTTARDDNLEIASTATRLQIFKASKVKDTLKII